MLLRPLPARNEFFVNGVAVAYIRASGETVNDSYEPWRDLISDIRAVRLAVHDIAHRLRSMARTCPADHVTTSQSCR
ncbi:hypothetical protein ACFVJ4_43045 [Streptomyces sp. NPDC127178]|uniref:hypothetical protein n=1 Tax=unclassified Streptomyces TaxID=2593676 RepID=UPI0036330D51